MSKRVQTSDGKTVALSPDNLVGRGGEGSVYRLPGDPQYAIKIYSKQPTDATARKLSVMVRHPPKVLANDGRVVIAWPVNLVKSQGRVAGFRMPLVVGGKQISTCYLPLECREVYPHFTFEHLTSIALNLATVVASIHGRGYVIGDIEDQNVLVLPDTTVALVDTDSFQIRDPDTNVIYPCTVKSREFAAPELRGMPADIERTCNHDCFGLAVLIFHLLYQGYHPFAGRYTGKGDQPSFDEVLAKGWYPYASTPNIPYEPRCWCLRVTFSRLISGICSCKHFPAPAHFANLGPRRQNGVVRYKLLEEH